MFNSLDYDLLQEPGCFGCVAYIQFPLEQSRSFCSHFGESGFRNQNAHHPFNAAFRSGGPKLGAPQVESRSERIPRSLLRG